MEGRVTRLLLFVATLVLAASARAAPPAVELVETAPIETTLDHADIPEAADVWLQMIAGAQRTIDLAEFYVTSAVAGAGLTTILIQAGMSQWVAGCIAAVVAFITRAGAILFGWKQPLRRG